MAFPIKTCTVCGEEFELKPDKPGFANRCPECSTPESDAPKSQRSMDADERKSASEVNEARRHAMRDLLYRKDSQAGNVEDRNDLPSAQSPVSRRIFDHA